jgi:Predicted ATPase (AAA+ superfamily)
MNRNIIGRKFEMSELQRSVESDRSEFVIVYGRRRVGKTYLVDTFFNGTYDFTLWAVTSSPRTSNCVTLPRP